MEPSPDQVKKVCKVFTVFFGARRGKYCSPQTSEDVLRTVKKHVVMERNLDPGIDMDVVFVNNDAGYEPGRRFLDSIAGGVCKRGVFRVLHRPNDGGCFGGFSHAFAQLSAEYDAFIFSEDDLFITRENIPARAAQMLNEDDGLTFIAFGPVVKPPPYAPHVGGGFGMGRTRDLLYICARTTGELHYPRASDYSSLEVRGEIPFTNIMWQLHLRVESLTDACPFCVNYEVHPHGVLAVHQKVDLPATPREEFFYQVGGLDPKHPLPYEQEIF